jgi:transcriptional regulator GlxA family with amidase domain
MTYAIGIDAAFSTALFDEDAKGGAEGLLALLSARFLKDERGGLLPWRKRRIEAFIFDHLAEPVLVEELALIADMSVSHFGRLFKQSFGCSPQAYVRRLRLDRARHLMRTTDAPLGEIAVACGLSGPSHLSKLFRKVAGQSPEGWRRLQPRPPAR